MHELKVRAPACNARVARASAKGNERKDVSVKDLERTSAKTHCCGCGGGAASIRSDAPMLTKDPVCGMNVDLEGAKWRHTHDGHEYAFCNPKCRERFIADPMRYLAATASAAQPAVENTGIVRVTATKDPVCGMDVDPPTGGTRTRGTSTFSAA
jgi:YHS domain-containing protein